MSITKLRFAFGAWILFWQAQLRAHKLPQLFHGVESILRLIFRGGFAGIAVANGKFGENSKQRFFQLERRKSRQAFFSERQQIVSPGLRKAGKNEERF